MRFNIPETVRKASCVGRLMAQEYSPWSCIVVSSMVMVYVFIWVFTRCTFIRYLVGSSDSLFAVSTIAGSGDS